MWWYRQGFVFRRANSHFEYGKNPRVEDQAGKSYVYQRSYGKKSSDAEAYDASKTMSMMVNPWHFTDTRKVRSLPQINLPRELWGWTPQRMPKLFLGVQQQGWGKDGSERYHIGMKYVMWNYMGGRKVCVVSNHRSGINVYSQACYKVTVLIAHSN